ncbi:pilus assembly PilX family protein [Alteromonas sp. CYL-A6]|uniref:pilus assembly PilX family protein n=1 Tax=Alteromonas nitratireducens TaxID=3390813 RepID=UPI0034AC4EB4
MMVNTRTSLQNQSGLATLTAVLMLLIVITLVTVFTGRIKSFEHQIMLNEQNQLMAFSAAQAGLERGLSQLGEEPSWDGTAFTNTLPNMTQFTVSAVEQDIERESASLRLFTFTSVGTSADGLGTSTQTIQAIQYSVLANPPDVPLIVAGGLGVSGNFEVAANPNGGGEGVPLSIWTDLNVDLTSGSGSTCGLQEFSDGNCSTDTYSEKGFKDSDILDNDPAFPTDLMEYLFNVPEAEWPSLRADADERLANCSSLDAASSGLIWVDGDCSLNANVIVGSVSDPVILVVTDGDLTMNGGAEINGMLFSFRKPGTVTDFELNMIGGARVNGVVASNHEVGHSGGTYNSVYDADILAELEQNDAFQRVAVVPGSWRDF